VDRIRLTKVTTLLRSQPRCPIMVRGSRYGEMLAVRAPVAVWRDPIRRFDYSAVRDMPVEHLAWARGKIVLIGATIGAELSSRQIGLRRDTRYGVERHADAIVTILGNAEPIPVSLAAQNVLLAILAALGAWLAYRGPRRHIRHSIITALAVLVSLALLSWSCTGVPTSSSTSSIRLWLSCSRSSPCSPFGAGGSYDSPSTDEMVRGGVACAALAACAPPFARLDGILVQNRPALPEEFGRLQVIRGGKHVMARRG